jgi:hypothetical protein
MYESFSSGGRLGRWKLPVMLEDDVVVVSPSPLAVPVWGAENVDIRDERKFAAGSKGPIGGRENF